MRDLHKLQEIARPSDSMLFYQDVEKEIEQETAAKLERFVAIKMRPIHNSVKKWADSAINGSKSVVGWFRTGGNKNREIIERAETDREIILKTNNTRNHKRKQREGTVQYTPL